MSDEHEVTSGTLRDRKRQRTRRLIVESGVDLFTRFGYENTTVADIAAAADIGTRTFFSYFASKEELLFPRSDARIEAATTAIDERRAGEGPVDVLLRALQSVGDDDDDMLSGLAALRLRLMHTVPAVRGRSLQMQLDAEREISGRLVQAFPDELDEIGAAALVGAFIGAVSGAIRILLAGPDSSANPDRIQHELQRAVENALGSGRQPAAGEQQGS